MAQMKFLILLLYMAMHNCAEADNPLPNVEVDDVPVLDSLKPVWSEWKDWATLPNSELLKQELTTYARVEKLTLVKGDKFRVKGRQYNVIIEMKSKQGRLLNCTSVLKLSKKGNDVKIRKTKCKVKHVQLQENNNSEAASVVWFPIKILPVKSKVIKKALKGYAKNEQMKLVKVVKFQDTGSHYIVMSEMKSEKGNLSNCYSNFKLLKKGKDMKLKGTKCTRKLSWSPWEKWSRVKSNLLKEALTSYANNETMTLVKGVKLRVKGRLYHVISKMESPEGYSVSCKTFFKLSKQGDEMWMNVSTCSFILPKAPQRVVCKGKRDVGFLLDLSASERNHYKIEKDFVKSFSSYLDVKPNGQRVSVASFSNLAELPIKLKDHFNVKYFQQNVDKVHYIGSITRIDRVLRFVQSKMFDRKNGGRKGAAKILFLLTDGNQTKNARYEDPALVSRDVRSSGIKLVVVGVGDEVDRSELVRLAGDPNNVYTPPSLSLSFVKELMLSTCNWY